MSELRPLSAKKLGQNTDSSLFEFESTDDLIELSEFVGQTRAINSLQFGVGIKAEGYNLFATGHAGTGRRDFIRTTLGKEASREPVPSDWCYINNFKDPQKPIALELPAGLGRSLRNDMEDLIEDLSISISVVFESDEYRNQMQLIADQYNQIQETELKEISNNAKKEGLIIVSSAQGFAVAPQNSKGEAMTSEEFSKLSDRSKNKLEKLIDLHTQKITNFLKQIPKLQRERRKKEKEITGEVTLSVVKHIIEEIKDKYQEFPEIIKYLSEVQEDVILNAKDFMKREEESSSPFMPHEKTILARYKVNVLIDNSETLGAPIVFEPNPNYHNLICRVEHRAQFGTLSTDFTLIKPGALHKANGGYLIIDLLKLLHHPFAWEGLKRALFSNQILIEPPEKLLGLMSTTSLDPMPIPLKIKVIILGTRSQYFKLCEEDPDFNDLFKVVVDFEKELDRTPENIKKCAQMIATLIRKDNLLPFHRDAIAKIMDQLTRLATYNEKISMHMRNIKNLISESNFEASKAGHSLVMKEDVTRAIEGQIYRIDRYREELYELYTKNTILVETTGRTVGQVNALSVHALGDYRVGKISRVTARVRVGSSGVVDIQREAKLGGAVHTKAVMILSSFLSSRYNVDQSLSLTANLVFEQSYSTVEGDSASAAELCALLSALSEVPIKQYFSITGSINQHGIIQAIGGINEKIEGFYDICKLKGFTGKQAVIIPSSNVVNLMLRQDIIEAVNNNEFRIYAVDNIDHAISLLTGIEAGEREDDQDEFPKGSINERVENRLKLFSKKKNESKK